MSLAAAIVCYGALIPLTIFICLYGFRSAWRSTPVGKIIMGLALSVFAILAIGATAFLFDPQFLNIIRVVVYSLMNVGLIHLVWVLVKVQRGERRECKNDDTEPNGS